MKTVDQRKSHCPACARERGLAHPVIAANAWRAIEFHCPACGHQWLGMYEAPQDQHQQR